jgi:ubiquinone/menaquinone biosynthesis C-methylase UbiE
MAFFRNLMLRMCGRPQGFLGLFGGCLMARGNRDCAAWIVDALAVGANDAVLEVGFGPGVGIALSAARGGIVAGVDPSRVMLAQATARNASAIADGRVDLRLASVDALPFRENAFDKAFAINSLQLWPDIAGGLREIRRVLRRGGRLGLGFTPPSGQGQDGLLEVLSAAGFAYSKLEDRGAFFGAFALKP